MTNSKTIDELNEQYASIVKEFENNGKKLFSEKCVEIFAKYPNIDGFVWDQATPSFCDGEPCSFNVHTDNLRIIVEGEELGGDNGWGDGEDERELTEDMDKVIDEFVEFVAATPGSMLQTIFGDGVSVTIKRNGKVTTDHYDCGY